MFFSGLLVRSAVNVQWLGTTSPIQRKLDSVGFAVYGVIEPKKKWQRKALGIDRREHVTLGFQPQKHAHVHDVHSSWQPQIGATLFTTSCDEAEMGVLGTEREAGNGSESASEENKGGYQRRGHAASRDYLMRSIAVG